MRALVQRVSSAEVWISSAFAALSSSIPPSPSCAEAVSAPSPTTPISTSSDACSTPSSADAISRSTLVGAPRDLCVGRINRGICALVGIADGDTTADMEYIVNKLSTLRLFDVGEKSWQGSIESEGLSVLLVSQFTLHASTKKAKPDFHCAMGSKQSRPMFETLVDMFRARLGEDRVATGAFGAMMDVKIVNDGPVTIMLDSWNRDGNIANKPTKTPIATTKEVIDRCAATKAATGTEDVVAVEK